MSGCIDKHASKSGSLCGMSDRDLDHTRAQVASEAPEVLEQAAAVLLVENSDLCVVPWSTRRWPMASKYSSLLPGRGSDHGQTSALKQHVQGFHQ